MKKILARIGLAGLLFGLSACAPAAVQQADETYEGLLELMPAFEMPDGAEAGGGGGGGDANSTGFTNGFRSKLSLAEVYQHYAAQLSAAGWRLVFRVHSEASIYSTWEVSDEGGNVVDGTLELTFEFPDAYAVTVTLTRR